MNRSNISLVGNTTIGTNLGGGVCVFKCKDSGNNLQFKTLSGGTGISMSATATVINICSTASGGTGGIGWSNYTNGSTVAGCGTVASGGTICQNTYYGVSAGTKTTTGRNNIGIGYKILVCNQLSNDNIAIGSYAVHNSIGYYSTNGANIGIGTCALYGNCGGCSNIAIGKEANYSGNVICNNIAIGERALYNNS